MSDVNEALLNGYYSVKSTVDDFSLMSWTKGIWLAGDSWRLIVFAINAIAKVSVIWDWADKPLCPATIAVDELRIFDECKRNFAHIPSSPIVARKLHLARRQVQSHISAHYQTRH